jgi:hypothetical protein
MREASEQAASSFMLTSTVVPTPATPNAQTKADVESAMGNSQAELVAQKTASSESIARDMSDEGQHDEEIAEPDSLQASNEAEDCASAPEASAQHAESSGPPAHVNAEPGRETTTPLEPVPDDVNRDSLTASEPQDEIGDDEAATNASIHETEDCVLVEASLAREDDDEHNQAGCDNQVFSEHVVDVLESPAVALSEEEVEEETNEEETTRGAASPTEQSFAEEAEEVGAQPTLEPAPEPTPELPANGPLAVETSEDPLRSLRVETQTPSAPSGAFLPTPKTQEIKRLQAALARDTDSMEAVKKATKEAEDRARNAELALEALREEQRRYQEQLEKERELRDKQLEEFRLMVEKATQNHAAAAPAPAPAPAADPVRHVEAKDDNPPAHHANASPESTPPTESQWQRVLDPASNAFYFVNEESGYATWSSPPHLQMAASDSAPPSAGPSTELTQDDASAVAENQSGATTTAPSRWVEYWDESVKARYWYALVYSG